MGKRKSILRNLFFAGFAIVIFSFAVIAVCFYSISSSNFEEQKEAAVRDKREMLISNAATVSEYFREVFSGEGSPMEREYRLMMGRATLDIISRSTNSTILVFDKDKEIVAASGTEAENFKHGTVSGSYVEAVLGGNHISDSDVVKDFGEDKLLTVGIPIIHENVVRAGVIISSPTVEIADNYNAIIPEMIVAVLITLIIAFLMFYLISKKITDPIKEINNAVTEFSKGNFKKRVDYKEKNELGFLSDNINHMADSIENLENMRSTFVSDVSHELRTPMTSITGFVEGILDGTIPKEKEEEYLSVVLSESKRLSRLVNDLLNISRLEGGYYKVEKTLFDINELLGKVLIKFEKSITEKNIQVNLELEDDVCIVKADEDGINQVVTNLMHNAVKFTPDNGEIDVCVSVKGQKAYVEIKNTGEGIAKDKLEYIWDRFYKTDTSRGNNPKGVGLGLFIVQSIISKHNQEIMAESEEGKYAKFTFTLDVG